MANIRLETKSNAFKILKIQTYTLNSNYKHTTIHLCAISTFNLRIVAFHFTFVFVTLKIQGVSRKKTLY